MTTSPPSALVQHVASVIAEQAGLQLQHDRYNLLEAAANRTMERAGLLQTEGFLQALRTNPVLLADVAAELTIPETHFLRDTAQLEAIRDVVLPSIVSARPAGHVVRAWSAGCATGEEAYSIAIVCDEVGVKVDILATDISKDALAKAAAGIYGPWSLRGVDELRRRAWFRRKGDEYEIDPRLRERVRFVRHNLAAAAWVPPAPPGSVDLILCRNVFIYFQRQAVERVSALLCETLTESGWLVTAPSDPTVKAPELRTVLTSSSIFYRRTGPPTVRAAKQTGAEVREARSSRPEITEDRASSGDIVSARDPAAIRARASREPLSIELQLRDAEVHLAAHLVEEARVAVRRALYLDSDCVLGHFLLGLTLDRMGQRQEALRALVRALDLLGPLAPNEPVPFSGGRPAKAVAATIRTALEAIREERA